MTAMMITGRQIRDARRALGWSLATLAKRANVPAGIVERAESTEHTPGIMLDYGRRLREAFERAGIAFGYGSGVAMEGAMPHPSHRAASGGAEPDRGR